MVTDMEQVYCERSLENVCDQGDMQILDSISFGKYSSESLAWEKWSPFSQNRRLEEVKRCSVSGSVAKKIAYFESYYKRIGAQKDLEKQGDCDIIVFESQARFAFENQADAQLLTTVIETGLAEPIKHHLEEIGRRDEISEEVEEMKVVSEGSGNNMIVGSKFMLSKRAIKANVFEKEEDICKIETRETGHEIIYGGSVSIMKYIYSCWITIKQLVCNFKEFRLLSLVVQT